MNMMRPLMIALSLAAFAPAAFAQNDLSVTDAKKFAVVGGYAVQKVHYKPISNHDAKFDGGSAATLSASWYVMPALAVELWGSVDKFEQRVRSSTDGKYGNIDAQPLSLSAQYHFLPSNSTIRPWVGLGYYQTNYSGGNNIRFEDGKHAGLSSAKGAIGSTGVDFNISNSWFVRANARYMAGSNHLTSNGKNTGDRAKMEPWVFGLGVGGRF